MSQELTIDLVESPHTRRVNDMVVINDRVWSCSDDYKVVIWNAHVRAGVQSCALLYFVMFLALSSILHRFYLAAFEHRRTSLSCRSSVHVQ